MTRKILNKQQQQQQLANKDLGKKTKGVIKGTTTSLPSLNTKSTI